MYIYFNCLHSHQREANKQAIYARRTDLWPLLTQDYWPIQPIYDLNAYLLISPIDGNYDFMILAHVRKTSKLKSIPPSNVRVYKKQQTIFSVHKVTS